MARDRSVHLFVARLKTMRSSQRHNAITDTVCYRDELGLHGVSLVVLAKHNFANEAAPLGPHTAFPEQHIAGLRPANPERRIPSLRPAFLSNDYRRRRPKDRLRRPCAWCALRIAAVYCGCIKTAPLGPQNGIY